MKIVLIAPLVSHATIGRIAALVSTNIDVVLIDVSSRESNFSNKTYPINKIKKIYSLKLWEIDDFFLNNVSILERLKDILRSYSIISENKTVLNKVSEILKNEKPDFVFFFYGPVAIHFLRIIKKINKQLKTVLIPNLIPSTIVNGNPVIKLLKKSISNEFINYQNWLIKTDLIFTASFEMKSFIIKKFNFKSRLIHVIPDLHPKSFFVEKEKILSSENKSNSLIFLGAPERWGGKIDNIDLELNEIINNKIQLTVNENVKNNSNLKCNSYKYFSDDQVFNGDLADSVYKNKVALITYNVKTPSERFRSTLPTRFFTALSAGLVIAVKSGHFKAVESFISKYNIGFVYKDISQLKNELQNEKKIALYSKNIIENLFIFTAESQSEKITQILKNYVQK